MFRCCLCWSAAFLFWLLPNLVGHHSNHSWCKILPQAVCFIMHKHPVTVFPRAEMNILIIWIFVSNDSVQTCSQLLADTSFVHAQNLTQHFRTRKQTSYTWDFLWSTNSCFRAQKGLTTFALQVVCQQLTNDGETVNLLNHPCCTKQAWRVQATCWLLDVYKAKVCWQAYFESVLQLSLACCCQDFEFVAWDMRSHARP